MKKNKLFLRLIIKFVDNYRINNNINIIKHVLNN